VIKPHPVLRRVKMMERRTDTMQMMMEQMMEHP
jgi:hypothetical protein